MNKLRSSAITQGVQRSPNRSMLRAVGFNDGDFNKPIIGVANGYSTITPCNIGLIKSSSLNPTALNIDLLGDLCTPWVIADDLSLFILI